MFKKTSCKMNNFLVQSLDRVLDYFLTVYCSGRLLSSQEEGKKSSANIGLLSAASRALHLQTPGIRKKKTRNTIFSGFYANMTFSPRRFRGARFSVDHRYLPALLLRQQQQPQPLLHRFLVICYRQASKSQSWAVQNLLQPCHMSNPSACRPIFSLHLWDGVVLRRWHFLFIILLHVITEERDWKQDTTILLYCPPAPLLWLELSTLYAKSVLISLLVSYWCWQISEIQGLV